MGKIFGISDLPVSTIGQAVKPFQELVPKPLEKFIKNAKSNKLVRMPLQDSYVKKPRIRNTQNK